MFHTHPLICTIKVLVGLLFWLSLAFTDGAQADTCPVIAGGESVLGDKDAEERLQFIKQRLDHEAGRARLWSWSWGITNAALTVGQLALIPAFSDSGGRADMIVGASTSAIAVVSLVFLPLQVMDDQREFHDRLLATPPEPDRCKLLGEGEALFIRDADNENEGRSWLMHGANLLLGVGGGLILWLGLDRWQSGVLNFAGSVLLGELMIWTQPDRLEDDLLLYRQGKLESSTSSSTWNWSVSPWFASNAAGFQWIGQF